MITLADLHAASPTLSQAATLLGPLPAAALMAVAEPMTLAGHGRVVTYSRKVFIPLTELCRDVCHYCTFAKAPRRLAEPFLTLDQCIEIAQAGKAAGCKEALFTLGDQPERRYSAARRWLDENGYASTLDYLAAAARTVFEETGLLPHLNPGVMDAAAFARLRPVSASMGMMVESTSERLCRKGGPHWGSPDKTPRVRLATLRAAGQSRTPFTTGLLIGIGETRQERLDGLLEIGALHAEFGHVQEVIIQNFRAKADTRMAGAPDAELEEHLWTIAAARLLLGPDVTIQAPPNLQPDALAALVRAGVNDWGGVSPVTPDHVNPEAPWPHLAGLEASTAQAGRRLLERLAIGPAFALDARRWSDPAIRPAILRASETSGRARTCAWVPGTGEDPPAAAVRWFEDGPVLPSREIGAVLDRARRGVVLDEGELAALFDVRGEDLRATLQAADGLRHETSGAPVTYVVNRNINYTNICLYKCGFCAFSKGSTRSARGAAYVLDMDEVGRRAAEAWARGATEVCLQGGIHPSYTGDTYLAVVRAVKSAAPDIHVHAFSPLEVTHGARTLGMSLEAYLVRLKGEGLSSLPGTAAEILDDEVRELICADKINTGEWFAVMRAAHAVGLRTTSTIMFGHVERYEHWARHLLRLRSLQAETGGFTEFVPLPFVPMEAPMARKGLTRNGPTFREALLMHAVARLALAPVFENIQTSWVKMGPQGAALALRAGANDLGGVLMDESITRAAGGLNGQVFDAAHMAALANGIGRPSRQRTTLYGAPERPSLARA